MCLVKGGARPRRKSSAAGSRGVANNHRGRLRQTLGTNVKLATQVVLKPLSTTGNKLRANGHKSLVAQQSLRETALGTAHDGKSLPCESAFNKNVFLVILPSVLVMTSDPSQMTEVLLKACACPSP